MDVSARFNCGFEQFQPVVQRSIELNRFGRESFTGLAAAAIALTTGFGPRCPNAPRALCKESYVDRNCRSGRRAARAATHDQAKPSPLLVGPLRQAARLERRQARHIRTRPLAPW